MPLSCLGCNVQKKGKDEGFFKIDDVSPERVNLINKLRQKSNLNPSKRKKLEPISQLSTLDRLCRSCNYFYNVYQ